MEARGKKSTAGLSLRQLGALLGRPSWVAGTVMLGLAIVFQLASLRLAPLIVVQPLGAVALVVTAILNSRATGKRLDLKAKRAVALCIGGVGLFVVFAAVFAKETPIRTPELITILVILAVVLALLGGLFLYFRRHVRAIFYIISAGVLYGFVATLAKVVINRLTTGDFDVLTGVCIVALVAATLLGAYFVQTAYSSGPPDLVIAGLTIGGPARRRVHRRDRPRRGRGRAALRGRGLPRRGRRGGHRRVPAREAPPARVLIHALSGPPTGAPDDRRRLP